MLEDGQCFCREDPTGPWDYLSPQGPKTFIYLPGNKDFCQSSPFFVSLLLPELPFKLNACLYDHIGKLWSLSLTKSRKVPP